MFLLSWNFVFLCKKYTPGHFYLNLISLQNRLFSTNRNGLLWFSPSCHSYFLTAFSTNRNAMLWFSPSLFLSRDNRNRCFAKGFRQFIELDFADLYNCCTDTWKIDLPLRFWDIHVSKTLARASSLELFARTSRAPPSSISSNFHHSQARPSPIAQNLILAAWRFSINFFFKND